MLNTAADNFMNFAESAARLHLPDLTGTEPRRKAFDRLQITEEMLDEQLALEQEMVDGGLARVLSADKSAHRREEHAQTAGARYLTKHILEPASAEITKALRTGRFRDHGHMSAALPTLRKLPADVLALLTLRSYFNASGREAAIPVLSATAIMVGRAVELEAGMAAFRKADLKGYKRVMLRVANRLDKSGAEAIARRFSVTDRGTKEWPAATCLAVGVFLLSAMNRASGLFKLNLVARRGKTEYELPLSPDAEARMEQATAFAAELCPALMPSLIPPAPWVSPYQGGYYSDPIQARFPLVKTASKAVLQEMEGDDLSKVLSAINIAQDTPWRVNGRLLAALKQAVEGQHYIAGLPDPNIALQPITDEDAKDEEKLKRWKRYAASVYGERAAARGKILVVHRVLKLAERFAGRDIYFPHQMDFRGRIYPLPQTLNPQGPDFVKATLKFARGFPLGDQTAADWLAVSGANHYGVDKVPFRDRIEWVKAHEAAILACAEDPFASASLDFWANPEVDAPWQFLAFCFEWKGYRREGLDYVCALPVNLDGSCNGIQHYSAALRDPEGAASVNLVPSDKPADIYGKVAKRTEEHLRVFLRPGGPPKGRFPWLAKAALYWTKNDLDPRVMAETWLAFGINRKITKRSVMTLPYGSTQFSVKGFIQEALEERAAIHGNPFPDATGLREPGAASNAAAIFLMPFVWQAIGETVKAARAAMGWLQECATVACAGNHPITWTTPDGFRVQQAYREMKTQQVEASMEGKLIKPAVRMERPEIDSRKQAQGIAPNWVHSMDACALRMFVNLANTYGLGDFSLIHDSYGAPPAKVELMARCLRESFVSLYNDNDPVSSFYFDMLDHAADALVAAVPEPPKKGSFDLSSVLAAPYAFA